MNGKDWVINSITENQILLNILNKLDGLKLEYYVSAGCIFQNFWNYKYGKEINYGIGDIDIIFFDNNDLSQEYEQKISNIILSRISKLNFKIDIKNQARVHLWYKSRFGLDIEPYKNLQDAVDSWPVQCSCIGVRKIKNEFEIYSSFGFDDLTNGILRPNKKMVKDKKIYYDKVNKWHSKWPELKIIEW